MGVYVSSQGGQPPELQEREYEVMIAGLSEFESSFNDRPQIKIEFALNGDDAIYGDDGEPVSWGEYCTISFGKKAKLGHLISMMFYDGEQVPDGIELDTEEATFGGVPLIGEVTRLWWRTRFVDNPQTKKQEPKTGWDIEFTWQEFLKRKLLARSRTGTGAQAKGQSLGQFMTNATATYGKSPSEVLAAIGVTKPTEIVNQDEAWAKLVAAFEGKSLTERLSEPMLDETAAPAAVPTPTPEAPPVAPQAPPAAAPVAAPTSSKPSAPKAPSAPAARTRPVPAVPVPAAPSEVTPFV